jgi:hypothetical protein
VASAIGVLQSGALRKAYALVNSSVISVPTDPVGPATTIPLPRDLATVIEVESLRTSRWRPQPSSWQTSAPRPSICFAQDRSRRRHRDPTRWMFRTS